MGLSRYEKQLHKIMNDKSPAKPTTATRAELELSISIISKRLLGPVNNVERLWLVEDRHELRKQLAALPVEEFPSACVGS